ncbi:PREDICTED: uncharacterized protein LOC105312271 isoform X2 [Amphimedon queenslandica]|uniref:CARD domain-containing protein n=1 Tax=Amphimedon queenslandica TaxID=400682 RepID=A0AAN0J176_AMPQE|nr:PREDICTED: uncharacterized protein LOC105312271 isoform X2 [Amphimedon queenslandica]|eukprot:XP_019850481.1 PREDICTED: uncharacterized protein LOC105312271 isoform X2 [Amphimedon queenslandica]
MAAPSVSGSVLIKRHYAELVEAIVNPTQLANAFYSKGLINQSSRMDAALQGKNSLERASKLLSDVERVIKASPQKFEIFLSVLKEQLTTDTLIKEIERQYNGEMTSTPPLTDESDTTTVRARKGDAKREGGGTTPTQHTGIEETGNEEISYWPAVKGIGAVMVVSLIIWFICMFVYSMPVVKDQLDKTADEALYSTIPTGSCHKLSDPKLAFEELHTEISNSKALGIHLKLPRVKLEIIERENRSEIEKLIDVLHACHEQDLCPCWEDIVSAVSKYGNMRKAKEIENKYIINGNKN